MKKAFHQIHLWLSLPLGVLITLICLSGACLVFEQEITQSLHPELYRIAPPPGGHALPPSQLVRCVDKQLPDSLRISALQYSGQTNEPCLISFENSGRRTLSVNPYTGSINGWIETPSFFRTVRKFHRWFMDAPPQRSSQTTGRTIVGWVTIATTFILISGLVIWFPRNRKMLKNRLSVSLHKGRHRFWYDSHVALGFYALAFLLMMTLTGPTWSFHWYRHAAYSLLGGDVPTTETKHDTRARPSKPKSTTHFNYTVWDQTFTRLQSLYPEYKSIKLGTENAQVIARPHYSRRQADTAFFNPHNGTVTRIDSYREAPRSKVLQGWFYALHTGTWGGIWSKTLYFLSALIGASLPLSGYYLWLKKRRKKS